MRTFVHKHLDKHKICARFVPHSLSDEQKQYWMETSRDFIDVCDQNLQFLESVITGDESWCYQYDLETKRQSMTWCSLSSPPPKKSRLPKSMIKTLLIVFFDSKGLIRHEFHTHGYNRQCRILRGALETGAATHTPDSTTVPEWTVESAS